MKSVQRFVPAVIALLMSSSAAAGAQALPSLAIPTASPVPAATAAPAPGFDCEKFIATSENPSIQFQLERIKKDEYRLTHRDPTVAAVEKRKKIDDRNEIAAHVAECYYAHRDYDHATKFYKLLSDDWIHEVGNRFGDCEGCIDAGAYGIIEEQEVFRHAALSFEKIGDMPMARVFIRKAYRLEKDPLNTTGDKKILADYNRLDAERIAAQKRVDAQRTKKSNAQAQADVIAFAKQFSGDRRTVALENGRPCRKAVSDTALGHLEVWYYGCAESSGIGNEWFSFSNGRLIEHTTY